MLKNPVPARAVLGAILAISAAAAGCSSAGPPVQVTARVSWTTTVLRWGSFFGGVPGNVGTRLSPVPVTLPGKVVQVGTSNAAQYALLSDGRLYAWGIGTQGELGNGRRKTSVTRPVRVWFPAGVKIASIPADAMPYDTGLAVDTRGRAWGWGDNGGGELCLGDMRLHATPVRLPLRQVTTLAGASNHALYDVGGIVYACGKNMKGDLGTGNTRGSLIPARVARLDGRRVTRLVGSADRGVVTGAAHPRPRGARGRRAAIRGRRAGPGHVPGGRRWLRLDFHRRQPQSLPPVVHHAGLRLVREGQAADRAAAYRSI